MAFSLPIISVPVAFGLAMVPHFAKLIVLARATGKFDNDNDKGRLNLSELEGKVPKRTLALAQRCAAAHLNGLESLVLYASGVAVAVATKVPTPMLSNLCTAYLASRVTFNVAYFLPPVANGLPRTLSFFACTGIVVTMWFQAAKYAVL